VEATEIAKLPCTAAGATTMNLGAAAVKPCRSSYAMAERRYEQTIKRAEIGQDTEN